MSNENKHVSGRIYSNEIKFLKSLTENNQDIFDTYYFGYREDSRKMSVPLARIEPLQSKALWSESHLITRNQ